MVRVRLARRKGVTTVNQRRNVPQERTTSSNLTDLGWVAARTCHGSDEELLEPVDVAGWEATSKSCGVGVAKLQGHSWASNPSNGLRVNVGTIPMVLPCYLTKVVSGKIRRRSMLPGWGGGVVVVRGRESRLHGEGPQRVRSIAAADGGRW